MKAKSFVFFALLLGVITLKITGTWPFDPSFPALNQSELITLLNKQEVKEVEVVSDEQMHVVQTNGSTAVVYGPVGESLQDRLQTQAEQNPSFIFHYAKSPGVFGAIWRWIQNNPAFTVLLIIILVAAAKEGKLFRPHEKKKGETSTITFADVAGVDEAKRELREVVDALRDPVKFRKAGVRVPKGVLLYGPPGTGKTLLARAVAGEAGVPFFYVGAAGLLRKYHGEGPALVAQLFDAAKKAAPSIIFIDEIDSIGRKRGVDRSGGSEDTLNQLLTLMDGFVGSPGVIVIAATNRIDTLDEALLRPGRFDRRVLVDNPDRVGREQILSVHVRQLTNLGPDVDLAAIAQATPGCSGAELANIVNEAGILAANEGSSTVSMRHFERAVDKVLVGVESRSRKQTPAQLKTTAYHEAGHALVTLLSNGADPLSKVSIIPRGHALGVTVMVPSQDHVSYSRTQLKARLAVMFGGRVAEELVFEEDGITTGAQDDLERATELAYTMIYDLGMGKLAVGYSKVMERDPSRLAEGTRQKHDEEAQQLLIAAQDHARGLLIRNRNALDALAQALLERETLNASEVEEIIAPHLCLL